MLSNGGPDDRIWHYDEEVLSGGGGSVVKRGSLDSPVATGQGEGAASSSFVALNLSLGRGGGTGADVDVNSHDWVMVEAPSNLQERGSSGGQATGAKVTISPSEEGEVDELANQEGPAHSTAGDGLGRSEPRGDQQELSVETASTMPPVTPTSPANGLPDEALSQVSPLDIRGHTWLCYSILEVMYQRLGSFKFLSNVFFLKFKF